MEEKPTRTPPQAAEETGTFDAPDAELLSKLASLDESDILAMACAEGIGGAPLASHPSNGELPELGTLDDQELPPDGPMSPEQYRAYMKG